MKKLMKSACGVFLLCGVALSSPAQQVVTWINPPGQVTAQTNVLAANQILEVVSVGLDTHSAIEVTVGGNSVVFGSGGNSTLPQPFIVAGPAQVVFRQVSATTTGAMFTYSISSLQPAVRNAARTQ
jgi:hypothetical protein